MEGEGGRRKEEGGERGGEREREESEREREREREREGGSEREPCSNTRHHQRKA